MTGMPEFVRLGYYLTKAEFAKRHASSIGGSLWSFLNPFASILIIWLALDYGLGLRQSQGPGFGRMLVAGLAAWLFFADAVIGGSAAIVANPQFVKKIRFPVILLPLSTVMVAFVIHVVIVAVILLLLILQDAPVGLSVLTLPAWMLLGLILAAAVALLAAAFNVFVPDVGAVLSSLIGLWFWLTPVVWPLSTIPQNWQWVAFLNPMTIVVEGYRTALTGAPMPVGPLGLVVLLGAILLAGAVSYFAFGRMRPAFADAL